MAVLPRKHAQHTNDDHVHVHRGTRQPPLKRRRTMPFRHSSTGTDDESADHEVPRLQQRRKQRAASSNAVNAGASSSSEYDNPLDDDYTTEEGGRTDDGSFIPSHLQRKNAAGRARRSTASSNTQNRSISTASEVSTPDTDDSANEYHSDNASSSGSSYTSPKALSPVEVNTANGKREKSTANKDRAKTAFGRVLRRDVPMKATLPRYPISPVKLLPPHEVHQERHRGFQVRPDQPSANTTSGSHHGRSTSNPSRTTLQAGLRNFANRMKSRVASNIGMSGHTRSGSASAVFPSSDFGKRKRHASCASIPTLRNHSPSIVTQTARLAHGPTTTARTHVADAVDLVAIQPIRRTRSVARKMEEIGLPVSEFGVSTLADAEHGHSRVASTSRGRQARVSRPQSVEESEAESLERSVAEMSLDEVSEHLDDDASEDVDNPDDNWYLQTASYAQLHRLRKDLLLRLVTLIESNTAEEDRSDFTKDGLAKLIVSARKAPADVEEEEEEGELYQSERGSSFEDDELGAVAVLSRRNSTRHARRTSTASVKESASAKTSPRRALSRHNSRSKSLPNNVSQASDAEDEAESSQATTRVSTRRGGNPAYGLSRMSMSSNTDRTPGRLRSGKLRTSKLAESDPEANEGDEDDEEEDEEEADRTQIMDDEDDVPTPIARRTRHRRNLSLASVSSAGYGDEEDAADVPNHEYRLRKVSLLPRRAHKGNGYAESASETEGDVFTDEPAAMDESEQDVEQNEEDEEVDEQAESEDEYTDAFVLASATQSSLLRLKRDDLLRLCRERDLAQEGTKKELVAALIEWREGEIEDVEEVEDPPDDEEYVPGADTSDISMVSMVSEADEDGEQDENVEDSNASLDSSAKSDDTQKLSSSRRRARRETKTQALARLSHASQSYDPTSQEEPLLQRSHQEELIHSPKVNTPPGSGDAQDNDLELDLESLNLLDKEIAPDKLKKGEKIGSGGFKDVYEGRYRNVRVALADIRGHLTENDLKELSLLRDLRHENIVRFIGVSIPEVKDVPVTIVSELCTNGDLFDYIRNVAPPSFDKVLSIMLNIARGIEYLHMRKPAIIHRDLKSSNVLITARGVAKVTDFGLARVRNTTRSIIKSLVGTVNWQAPELWVPHPRYNEKVDVYSAALVFWECLQWHLSQKRYPFEGMNEHAIYQEVGHRQFRPSTATMRRQWGGDILDLVDRMWAQDPKDRPNMTQVVQDLEVLLAAEKARMRAAR